MMEALSKVCHKFPAEGALHGGDKPIQYNTRRRIFSGNMEVHQDGRPFFRRKTEVSQREY